MEEKNELLDLYNAINGSTYTDEEDILEASKAEVLEMVLFEYNEELHIESEKKIAREEGREILLTTLIRKKLAKGLSVEEIADMLEITVEEVQRLM